MFYIIRDVQRLILILVCSLWNVKTTHLICEITHSIVARIVVIIKIIVLLLIILLNLRCQQDLILIKLIHLLSLLLMNRICLIIAVSIARVMKVILLLSCLCNIECLRVVSGRLIQRLDIRFNFLFFLLFT